jgi:hypothetical protein
VVRYLRDRSLILLGFWRGFRGDELVRLSVEHLEFIGDAGMHCFLGSSKSDRAAAGKMFKVPALRRWCPVEATRQWLDATGITSGPLFRRVGATGQLESKGLHANSVVRLLRSAFARAGLQAEAYSSHSLRRGFAGWASANGWDLKSLMEYVGWRDIHSAMRYIDARDPFQAAGLDSQADAPRPLALAAPQSPARPAAELQLEVTLVPLRQHSRGRAKALRIIEQAYLAEHAAQRLNAAGTQFRLSIVHADQVALENTIATLVDEIHRIASNHDCSAEVSLTHSASGRRWE